MGFPVADAVDDASDCDLPGPELRLIGGGRGIGPCDDVRPGKGGGGMGRLDMLPGGGGGGGPKIIKKFGNFFLKT